MKAQSSSFAPQAKCCEWPLTSRFVIPCCPLLSSAVPQGPPSYGPGAAQPALRCPNRLCAALSDYAPLLIHSRTCVRYAGPVGTWHDLDVGRPMAAPLERCAELLDVDLVTVRELAAKVEPYIRADGTRIWSRPSWSASCAQRYTAGAEAATSTVDERGSSPYRPDQADRHFQQLRWLTPSSMNLIGSMLARDGADGADLQNHSPSVLECQLSPTAVSEGHPSFQRVEESCRHYRGCLRGGRRLRCSRAQASLGSSCSAWSRSRRASSLRPRFR